MDQWCVTLNPLQVEVTRQLALRRQRSAWSRGAQGRNGAPNDWSNALALHVRGAPGEYAYWAWVFYHTNRGSPRWASRWRGDFDFFPDIDIKTVDDPRHRLIIQRGAPTGWRFLLVDGSCRPTYRMVGWMWGGEAKQKMWWRDRVDPETKRDRSAYFVPRLALRGMGEWRFDHPWEAVDASWSDPYPRSRAYA